MIRLPSAPSSVPSHLGADVATCAPCQATSCFNTGLVTLIVGGAIGAFVGINLGSFIGAYHVTKPRR